MERKLLYAFRGWIAFVAFMDLGTAFRSYIERRSFLDHADTQFIEGKCTLETSGSSVPSNFFVCILCVFQVITPYHVSLECIAFLRH